MNKRDSLSPKRKRHPQSPKTKSGGATLTLSPLKPNMLLADQYNRLRDQKRQVKLPTTDAQTITLYEPFPSEKQNKKLSVYVLDSNNQIKLVHFGHPDYEDYTIHQDEKRRKNYCARSSGIKCQDKQCDLTSPNYWSRTVLWNC